MKIKPWLLVSAAWIGPAVLGGLDVIAQNQIWGDGPLNVRRVLFVSLDWLLYALLTPFVFLIARRWPLSRPRLVQHAALHLVFSLLFCAAWAGAGTVLRVLLEPKSMDAGPAIQFASWLFITLPFGVAVYLAVVGIEHAIRYFEEASRLAEQLTGARLAALQAQLNPHFLFNSLNTIAVLVRGGESRDAARVVEQLSDVLRRTLGRQGNEIALEEELELVRQYLAVEQARFSDRLRPAFDVDPSTLAAAIPTFALQHLVENAVRHGIARRTEAGRVAVAARREGDVLELTVEDDGPGIADDAPQTAGHGLENTRERLRTLYGDRAWLDVRRKAQGTIAVLRVPFRHVDRTDRG
ncbi:MAG TPA: histidine kinase [Thermoanaerobaculia bacterium]|nr:histidine kinase [Thermoanaerobaculia bacterium]